MCFFNDFYEPKKPSAHPKYSEMVGKAISALKERGGSSRQAILKYIMANLEKKYYIL
jgi:histone H1/5